MDHPAPRIYTPLRQLDWRIVFGLIALNTICLFAYRQLEYVASNTPRPALLTFTEEAVGGFAGLVVFPLIYLAAVRFPLVSRQWRRNLLAHLAAVCLISTVHTTVIALSRLVVLPVLGYGDESYGYLPARYPMEFSHLFIYYWFSLTLIYFFHEVRFARERELYSANLQRDLAEAQVQNLRLQLEPHFLFNTLNAISAAIYEDPRTADEMIGRLGELLRQLLKDDRSQRVPLTREIEILQLYIRIMEARFEDRLTITVTLEPGARHALVPQLLLQPLLENAIRHGMNASFEAWITIQAQCDQDELLLTVRDHGPGLDESKPLPKGIGLQNTANRLEQLYGRAQSFQIYNAPGGGAMVELRIPLQVDMQTEAADFAGSR